MSGSKTGSRTLSKDKGAHHELASLERVSSQPLDNVHRRRGAPLTVRKEDGALRFELSPHLNLVGEDHEHYRGGRRWEVSS